MEDAGSVALSEALRSSFFIVRLLLAGLVIYFLVSNVSFVGTQERALVLRFGNPVVRDGRMEQGPGIVWAWPYPIDEVVRIPVTELQTARSTVGWYAVTPDQEEQGIEPEGGVSLNPAIEGYAITGEGNIIHARAQVRYRITDPVKFSLNHRDGATLMTNLIDNAVMYAAARFSVDDALRRNVTGFKEAVLKRANDLVTAYDVGVTIEASDVITQAPRQVKTEFRAVGDAEQERGKTISEAQSYQNRVINEANGLAEERINLGNADRNRMVQEISSEARSFEALLPEYRKNPGFFRERLLVETLGRVLTNAQQKFPVPLLKSRDQIWINLNKDPEKLPKPQSLTP